MSSKPTAGAKASPAGSPTGRTQHGRPTIPPAATPAGVRNVALIGHGGVGKTTLVEHLLAFTATISRPGSVVDGTTLSDSDPIEVGQQRSVFLSACPLEWKGVLVNLLDTPGYGDFVGELRAGLRAADAALFVVSAADPLDDSTLALWEECSALNLPRALVVNRLEMPRADLRGTVEACRAAFGAIAGNAIVLLAEPVDDNSMLVGLLERGAAGSAAEADRASLIEAIIAESEDETLLEDYLADADLDRSVLLSDLHTAVSRGHLHPVLPVCISTHLGLAELLDLVVDGLPSPVERPLPRAWTPVGGSGPELECDPDGPLAAEVVRTWTDPYVGRVSLVRVFSGTLRGGTPLHVIGRSEHQWGHVDHDVDERASSLLSVGLAPTDDVVAGNLCLVTRLSSAETGDTLCQPDRPLVMLPWELPPPLLPVAVAAATRNDEDHLARALGRLTVADPSVRVERNAATGQLVLWCLGDAHAEVVLGRLRSGGAAVVTEPVRIALQATFADRAEGNGRHVKQSGGHGQYAVCSIAVEPMPRGSGLDFVDAVVGGAVPHQFIPSVEKGVRTQLAHGLAHGVPIVDVRVTLHDGKAHSVDSSDAAFQLAGALAVKDAATSAGLQVLEPIDEVDIMISDRHIGAVLSDLSGRRGRVTGTEEVDSDRPGSRSVVHAEIPGVELVRYAPVLRSLTGGSGTFTRKYLRHDPAPTGVAESLLPK